MDKVKIQKLISLSKRCLELAENGDYSNGVGEFGSDEGRYMAGELLKSLRSELEELIGE